MTGNVHIKQASITARSVLASHAREGTLMPAIDALGIPPTPPGQFWRVNQEAVLFWREFVKAGGLVLDPKVWKIDSNAQAVAAKAIEWALLHGKDGSTAAAHFLYESGESCDVTVDSRTYVVERVTSLFTREINRAFKNSDAAQMKS